MSRQYTDSAKVFISIVYLTMISIVVLVAFLLYSPENDEPVHTIPQDNASITCSNASFIGYVDADHFTEFIKISESTRYSLYCLKKTGAYQWSVYAN